MVGGAQGVQRSGSHWEQKVDWQVGDFAVCITPGSKLENRQVMIVSRALVDPSRADVVYRVHPGFSDGANWGWGAERRHLRPLPEPNEPGTWDDCVFKPRELVH